jgi:hypothetical protein
MKNIQPFRLFEAEKVLHPEADEFMKSLDSTEWGKKLSELIETKPVKTGRVYITSRFLPVMTYFWKSGSNWNYVYVSSGNEYGEQRSPDLSKLFEEMVIDCIKKAAPTGFSRNDVDKMVSNKKWIFDNISMESLSSRDIYKKYRDSFNPGVLNDFSKIRTPLMDRLLFNGLGRSSVNTDDSITMNFTHQIYNEHNASWPFHIIASLFKGSGMIIFKNGIDTVNISPGSPGSEVKTSRYRVRYIKIKMKLGYQNSYPLMQKIDEILSKYIKKVEILISDKEGTKKSEMLTNLYHDIALSDNNGSWEEILDDYIKKNPLDIGKLDSNPEIKAGVLKRTGIKDYSSIASALKMGML